MAMLAMVEKTSFHSVPSNHPLYDQVDRDTTEHQQKGIIPKNKYPTSCSTLTAIPTKPVIPAGLCKFTEIQATQ
jgi:hypothetical protein